MKKTFLATVIFAGLSVLAFNASASNTSSTSNNSKNTISLGYAHSNLSFNASDFGSNEAKEHFEKEFGKSLQGLNLKYRYEFNDEFGVISSLTYTQYDFSYDYYGVEKSRIKWSNTSLMAGPSYRFNEYISAYGLIGANYGKVSHSSGDDKSSYNDTSLSYGIGLQFNPTQSWVIDTSYSHAKLKGTKIGTWVFGVGYRF
ncbi:Ail/Lom family outer membrane beta-barrel protein [Xenorhabdus szentirmaii]|uniref:Outer membrane beta-barrel protein n=1 Tax=Xenorhabdus szentirmaii TaxID=290112 RepID=A0AAW3YMI8_9GAMM|nr:MULTISPECIES: Ail/Lom family outer membrane beta-barrel protein [unclassified Xenorhabdus]MBD2780685.1 outer membrane beta-barrel protein [Xenorhabdus sp. 38]MBD2799253.1 outer membrane beta-barrel protein [Xenorhabdus sp. M]